MVRERNGKMNTEEIMEISTEMSSETETLAEVPSDTQILEGIANDVHIIMVLALITFITSYFFSNHANTK